MFSALTTSSRLKIWPAFELCAPEHIELSSSSRQQRVVVFSLAQTVLWTSARWFLLSYIPGGRLGLFKARTSRRMHCEVPPEGVR